MSDIEVLSGNLKFHYTETIAMLQMEPHEIESKYGISFEEGCDDLEEFKAAFLRDKKTGKIFLLYRNKNQFANTTDVIALRNEPLDPAADLLDFLKMMKLSTKDLFWINEVAMSADANVQATNQ